MTMTKNRRRYTSEEIIRQLDLGIGVDGICRLRPMMGVRPIRAVPGGVVGQILAVVIPQFARSSCSFCPLPFLTVSARTSSVTTHGCPARPCRPFSRQAGHVCIAQGAPIRH